MYIEDIMITNFIIDYSILNLIKDFLKINTSTKRIIISSLLGELSLLFINNSFQLIIKILFSILLVIIAFKYKNIIYLLKELIYFYTISFFLGGILYYLKINSLINYSYFILLVPFILNIYKRIEYNLNKTIKTNYKVTIYLNNGEILYLNGFMDTGNTLIEPYTNKKVIFINKNINENYFLVPYNSITQNQLVKCFKPKKVYIDNIGERKDIVVGILNNNSYECILNYKIMEE